MSKTNNPMLLYCEEHGIYQMYKAKGNVITYYSYYGTEGFYKVTVNVVTGREVRKHLRYKNTPDFLKEKDGLKYNYYVG